ncbi:MAG: hypothetical protein ABJN22_14660 [Litorimonas sp.]
MDTRYIYPNPDYDQFLNGLLNSPSLSFGPDFNLSLFRYVENNPINLIDPSGRFGIGYVNQAKDGAVRARLMAGVLASASRRLAIRQGKKATQALKNGASKAKEFGKNNADCAAAFAAGFAKEAGDFDAGGADSPEKRRLANCFSAGALGRSALELFSGG